MMRRFATLLIVGLLLVPVATGGDDLPTSLHPRTGQTATLLPDGRWLLLGGQGSAGPQADALIWDPRTRSSALLPQGLGVPRAWHSATVMPDGTVVVIGGLTTGGQLAEAVERFDPVAGQFERLSTPGPRPRAYHSVTLLTDGRLLIAGGVSQDGAPIAEVALWHPRHSVATSAERLLTPRSQHEATLLGDGSVLLWGGIDAAGSLLTVGEVYDPVRDRITQASAGLPEAQRLPEPPRLEASLPADGAASVSIDAVIALRFSKPLSVETVNDSTLLLTGPNGLEAASVVAAEGGRLVFVTRHGLLVPDAAYTLSINGPVDSEGFLLPFTVIQFTTEPPPAPVPDGTTSRPPHHGTTAQGHHGQTPEVSTGPVELDDWEWRGERRDGKPYSPWQELPPLRAPDGVTALAGQVLKLNGQPLANVTLTIGTRSSRTDDTGRFVLLDIPAGYPTLNMDGSTASRPGKTYATFDYGVRVRAGVTNVLPYTIWLPLIDTQHAVTIPVPTTTEVVVRTPRVPGLEMRIPAGVILRTHHGQPLTSVTLTELPVDRTPFPLPEGTDFFFTPQTHGARVERPDGTASSEGVRFILPNARSLAPGVRIHLTAYDVVHRWHVYGEGTVTRDGRQIMPDPRVEFHLVGCVFALANPSHAPPTAPKPGETATDGDPVNLSTGLFIFEKTDLVVPDVIPIVLQRTYRPERGTGPFGFGHYHSYQILLTGDQATYQWADLVLPAGTKVRYTRTSPGTDLAGAVMEHTTSGTGFYQSVLTRVPSRLGWDLTFRDGTVWEFVDGAPGPWLTAMRDRWGNQLTITREPGNEYIGRPHLARVLRITSPSGRWVEFSYPDEGSVLVSQIRDPAGRTVSYTYEPGTFRLLTVTDAGGGVTEYSWDPATNRILTLRDARGIVFLTNEYDAAGRVSRQTQADGTVYQFAYTLDANGQLIQTDVTNPRGFVRQVTFDANNYTATDTRGVGTAIAQTTSYTRDSANRVTAIVDPLNRRTEYTYDGQGNVLTVTRLAGTAEAVTTSFTYEATFQQVASVTDPLSHPTTFGYDALGNLTTITDPTGRQTTLSYNAQGQPVTITTPAGTTTLAYQLGDLASVTDPTGNTTTRFTDAVGRLVALTTPLGQRTGYEYDALNRLTKITDALGGITQFGYDPNGNLLSVTDARSNATTYAYDTMDRLQTRTDPLLRSETYTYDPNGNLATFTDRKSQITSRTYDALDRLSQVTYADTSTTTYTWDAGNRLTETTDSISGTITRTYDNLDRSTQETTPQGSVSYTYDAAGRRASMTVAGQPTVTYAYDNANRLTSITQGSNAVSITYDAAGRRATVTLPNGVSTEYTYDPASRLTGLTYKNGPNTLGTLSYGYDATSSRRQVSGTWARTGLPQALASATYNAANHQLTFGPQVLTYDLNGNLTSDGTNTYTWDARNRLTGLSGPAVTAAFEYDPLGRRARKTINGTSTDFLYDGLNPVQEVSGAAEVNLLTGLGVDEVITRTDGSGTLGFLTDALGSTVATTDATGTVQSQLTYAPFGATSVAGPAAPPYQFTGRENDATGLYYYRARYYSPALQRFIAEDPIGFTAGDLNLYAYVSNTPTNLGDPLGLDPIDSKDDCSYAAMGCVPPLGGRKDGPTGSSGLGPQPIGVSGGKPAIVPVSHDPHHVDEAEAHRRQALQHILRQAVLRRLNQIRGTAKPGHAPIIEGAGPRTGENIFNALRGSRNYKHHVDRTGGGHGYYFDDPELGRVMLRYTPDGRTRIEIGGFKFRIE